MACFDALYRKYLEDTRKKCTFDLKKTINQ